MFNLPLPFSGLILAIFALANLVKSYSISLYNGLSVLGLVLLVMMTIRILFKINDFTKGLKHPLVSSVLPTYSMAIILASGYLRAFEFAPLLWYLGIILHLLFIVNYTTRFLFKFELKNIFPSIFIVYIGIVCSSVVSYQADISRILLYFAMIVYIPLLILVIYRMLKIPLPNPAKPTFMIFAAPVSLCLAGYLSIAETSPVSIWALLIVSQVFYLLAIYKIYTLIQLDFGPSFAAFTFPLVISAIALKKSMIVLAIQEISFLVHLETIIAMVMVTYIFYCFARTKQSQEEKKAA